MKNLTLRIDDDIFLAARRYAVERNSSVNALVREYLTNLAGHEDRARRARAKLKELSNQSDLEMGEKTWSREDLHER